MLEYDYVASAFMYVNWFEVIRLNPHLYLGICTM